MPELITGQWAGDFDDLKNILNRCIDRNASEASHVATAGVEAVKNVNSTIDVLGKRSTEIDQVVKVIKWPMAVMASPVEVWIALSFFAMSSVAIAVSRARLLTSFRHAREAFAGLSCACRLDRRVQGSRPRPRTR